MFGRRRLNKSLTVSLETGLANSLTDNQTVEPEIMRKLEKNKNIPGRLRVSQ